MSSLSDDASQAAFAVLRDQGRSQAEREAAFQNLVNLPRGFWGEGGLVLFAHATSLAIARSLTVRLSTSSDRLDWEGVALDSLFAFFVDAPRITKNPRGWLIGTIHNLLRMELRRNWRHITTAEIPEDFQLKASDTSDEESVDERRRLALNDHVIAAIQELPPSLRILAQLWLVEGHPISEIPEVLNLSPATVRKRAERTRRALREKLQAKHR